MGVRITVACSVLTAARVVTHGKILVRLTFSDVIEKMNRYTCIADYIHDRALFGALPYRARRAN